MPSTTTRHSTATCSDSRRSFGRTTATSYLSVLIETNTATIDSSSWRFPKSVAA